MRLARAALCLPLGLLLLFMPPVPVGDRTCGDRPSQPPRPGQKTPVPVAEDEPQLQQDVKSGDVSAVLAFFRKRPPAAAAAARLRGLVRRLRDASPEVRDGVMYHLLARGPAVTGLLRQALREPDAEVAA